MIPTLDREFTLKNAITGGQYTLKPIYKIAVSETNLEAITKICNEPLVYQWCFRELCKDKPYPLELAREWLAWGTEGWLRNIHYVYAVIDSAGLIAAACDIKSSNLESAEVGYWASQNHRGVMTNAVREVVKLADECGFKILFADIHPQNKRSLAVIQRCGFSQVNRLPTIAGHTPFDRISPQH